LLDRRLTLDWIEKKKYKNSTSVLVCERRLNRQTIHRNLLEVFHKKNNCHVVQSSNSDEAQIDRNENSALQFPGRYSGLSGQGQKEK
jgi:hypothetical protein